MTLNQNQKIPALLNWLKDNDLAGFIVPQADEFQGEYFSDNNLRLQWLTGFTGSAGTAVVYDSKVHLFVDGRYTLQAPKQVDPDFVEVHPFRDPGSIEWLAERIRPEEHIGYDPKLHPVSQIMSLNTALNDINAEAKALENNPIDHLWQDRPTPPMAPVEPHDIAYTGVSSEDKIKALAEGLASADVDALVLNELDAIAWTFNIRGGDTAFTPLAQAYAIIHADGSADLFAATSKFSEATRSHLGPKVSLREMEKLSDALDRLGSAGAKVNLDKTAANEWTHARLKKAGAEIVFTTDPTKLARAIKNETEIAGAHAAHQRDAVAMVRFLKWLDETALNTPLTEIAVADRLYAFRAESEMFRGLSFATIAGSGPDGAIVHFHATPENNRPLVKDSLLLLDSGAQYPDGTTDITRTLPIGTPSEAMRRHFTLVLKGHIAIASARFPAGTTGGQLDALARQHLWRNGLNYDHGTGHGVGSYLGVHEGPHRLASGSTIPLQAGMILSNEPGLYLTDQYGIRIENLIVVQESSKAKKFLEFAPLTLVPIDRRLIDISLMEKDELDWLNTYHGRIRDTLFSQIDDDTKGWLDSMCAPMQG